MLKEQFPGGIDVLCNNAGVMALEDQATKEGYDVQMQTNHLSHFLLTREVPMHPLESRVRTFSRSLALTLALSLAVFLLPSLSLLCYVYVHHPSLSSRCPPPTCTLARTYTQSLCVHLGAQR